MHKPEHSVTLRIESQQWEDTQNFTFTMGDWPNYVGMSLWPWVVGLIRLL